MALTQAGLTNIGLGNGVTQHYNVGYDTSLPNGTALTNGLLAQCEADFRLMQLWFGGIELRFAYPLNVQINNTSGNVNASWQCPSDFELLFSSPVVVNINSGTSPSIGDLRVMLVAEVSEMFMMAQNRGWFYGQSLFQGGDEGSKGEGLSRFLAYQSTFVGGFKVLQEWGVVKQWLNPGSVPFRSDFINNNPDDNSFDATVGCTTLFMYYLHYQLGFGVPAIVNAAGSTLTSVYQNLTGQNGADGWTPFINLINSHYPPGINYNPITDNLFPVSNLISIQAPAVLICGASSTITILVDNPAMAEVVVQLSSADETLLTVQSTATIPPGASAVTVPVQATAQALPFSTKATTISATYAGNTVSSRITIVSPSVLALTITSSNIICGDSAIGTITLNAPSLKGVAEVSVASSDPSVLQVLSPVTFGENAVVNTFPINTSNIHVPFVPVPVTVTAQLGGTTVVPFVVNVVSPTVADLQISPSGPIACGSTCTGTITLDRASFDGDVLVDMFWEPRDFAVVSTPVVLKQGTMSTTFSIVTPVTIPPFGGTQGLLYASYAGTNVSAWLTLAPSENTGVLASVTVESPVLGGTNTSGTVHLVRAVAGPTVVTLRIAPTVRVKPGSNTVLPVAKVAPSITIPAGNTGASFTVTTEPLSPQGPDRTVAIVANAFVTKSTILTFKA
jgi:hypothetical protein